MNEVSLGESPSRMANRLIEVIVLISLASAYKVAEKMLFNDIASDLSGPASHPRKGFQNTSGATTPG